MKRKLSYLQLLRTNKSKILADSEEMDRIDTIIDQRRTNENQKTLKK